MGRAEEHLFVWKLRFTYKSEYNCRDAVRAGAEAEAGPQGTE